MPSYVVRTGGDILMLNRLDDAAAELKRAVEIDPTVDDWHNLRAQVLLMLERLPEALKSVNDALRYKPENAAALSMRGEILRSMGRTEEALADLDRALQITPNDAWTLASKGEALRYAGRLSDAAQALRQAMELQPKGYPFAETSLGYVCAARPEQRVGARWEWPAHSRSWIRSRNVLRFLGGCSSSNPTLPRRTAVSACCGI
jgi:tetratricopeptide (TPR) repeat protein